MSHPAQKVGLVDLGLEGTSGFPAEELGFSVSWRSAPKGVRKAIRHEPVIGVIVQCEVAALESTAAVFRSIERQDKRIRMWLAMVSPDELLLSRVVSVRRIGLTSAIDGQVLTPRELEVLTSIRQGMTNQAIALTLGVSLSTVKRHIEHILVKLASKNRAQAAARLRRQST